jgi:hypothetical protein
MYIDAALTRSMEFNPKKRDKENAIVIILYLKSQVEQLRVELRLQQQLSAIQSKA